MSKFYVTTTIYYVNDVPHIGHAYTTLVGDVISRYWKLKLGDRNTFFLTGTDEHGQKIQQVAAEKKLSPKNFADSVVPRFKEAWKALDINYDFFIRTTDPRHEKVVIKLLKKIRKNGYIYKGIYKGLYCVGCEKFLVESDLVDGKCQLHPNKKPEYQEEENYFLKLKELSERVLNKIENGEYEILPQKRKNEIVSRLKQGVDDISISRAGVSWGIPLPWDKNHTIYVWVDALINYFSATQFLRGKKKFWPADIHVIGKDIVWFHTVIWQALLIAAGVELPKVILAHGFFTIDGQKISKSLGNVISPQQLVERYGSSDAVRYLLLSASQTGEDADISFQRFDEKYQSDLANGLGNLVQRVTKLCELKNFVQSFISPNLSNIPNLPSSFSSHLENFEFNLVLEELWKDFGALDAKINLDKPWEKSDDEAGKNLKVYVEKILQLTLPLSICLPLTATKIQQIFKGPKISAPSTPLFPRLTIA